MDILLAIFAPPAIVTLLLIVVWAILQRIAQRAPTFAPFASVAFVPIVLLVSLGMLAADLRDTTPVLGSASFVWYFRMAVGFAYIAAVFTVAFGIVVRGICLAFTDLVNARHKAACILLNVIVGIPCLVGVLVSGFGALFMVASQIPAN